MLNNSGSSPGRWGTLGDRCLPCSAPLRENPHSRRRPQGRDDAIALRENAAIRLRTIALRIHSGMCVSADSDNGDLRRFVDRWRRTGTALAAFEAEELRTVDQSAALRIAAAGTRALLQIDPPGPSSGLVELQRWFAIARLRAIATDRTKLGADDATNSNCAEPGDA